MNILSVLSARASQAPAHREHHQARHALWPVNVNRITFVITTPHSSSERFIAYAIDTDGTGVGLYTIDGPLTKLHDLMAALAAATSPTCPADEGTGDGKRPSKPTILPIPGDFVAGPADNHFSVALAMIHQRVISSMEQLARPHHGALERGES